MKATTKGRRLRLGSSSTRKDSLIQMRAATGAVIDALEKRTLFGNGGYVGGGVPSFTTQGCNCNCPPLDVDSSTYNPGDPSPTTDAPVTYFNGRPVVSSVDLSFDASGRSFDWVRAWSGANDGSLNGNGWMVEGLPYLVVFENQYTPDANSTGIIDAIFSPSVQRRFDVPRDTMSGIAEENAGLDTMTYIAPTNSGGVNLPGEFHFTDQGGNTTVFYDLPRIVDSDATDHTTMGAYGRLYGGAGYVEQPSLHFRDGGSTTNPYPYGAFKSYTDAYGNVTEAEYDGSARLVDLVRTDAATGAQERYDVAYTGSGGVAALTNAEGGAGTMISSVTLQERSGTAAAWVDVRSAVYGYYSGDTAYGRLGDLRMVTIEDEGHNVISQKYYRYESVAGSTVTNTSWPGYDQRGPTDSPQTSSEPVSHPINRPGTNVTGWSNGTQTITVVMSALTAVVEDDAYDRLVAAEGSSLDAISAGDLAHYAQHTFEYEPYAASDVEFNSVATWWRVSQETATGEGCSTCSNGVGTFDYHYDTRSVGGTPQPGDPYYGLFYYADSYRASAENTWVTKTTVTLPDASDSDSSDNDQEIAYTNVYGQVLFRVLIDHNRTDSTADDQMYGWYYEYNAKGQLILAADPSAVNLGYSLAELESYPDLVGGSSPGSAGETFRYLNTTGLVHTYTYYDSNTGTETSGGGAKGYLQADYVQRGGSGTPVQLDAYSYRSHTNSAGVMIHPLDSYEQFIASGDRTTSYNYDWYPDASHILAPRSVTTTYPTISTSHNGPGTASADVEVDYLDNWGRVIFHKDADNYLTYNQYDAVTFGLAKHIEDADTGDFTGTNAAVLPSGFSTPSSISGSHLSLKTTYQTDALGRTTRQTTPNGNRASSPNGNVMFTVYDDAAHETRVYQGTMSGTNFTEIGPTAIHREDWSNGYTEDLTLVATPTVDASGIPTGQETITTSGIRTLSRTLVNNAGQVIETDSYPTLSGATYSQSSLRLGTAGTNYYATTYGYDGAGRLDKIKTPNGSITRTVYDALGNVKNKWVGTNDTPSSGYWSPSNPAGMTDVEDDYYDNVVNTAAQLQTLAAPALPSADTTGEGTGDPFDNINCWVTITYVDSSGRESVASQILYTQAFPDGDLVVHHPTSAPTGVTGYNVYVTSGVYGATVDTTALKLQNSTPVDIDTDFSFDPQSLADGPLVRGYSIGDGNLTRTVTHPTTNAASYRVTETQYDWRDRPVISKSGVLLTTGTQYATLAAQSAAPANAAGETDSAHRLITYVTYDNQDEVTEQDTYAADGYSPTGTNGVVVDANTDGVPDAPDDSRLRAKVTVAYDEQGRAYRRSVFSVNPSSGTASTSSLDTNVFYNHRGQVVDVVQPGGLASKTAYDGAGRIIVQYTTDGGATNTSPGTLQGWSDANTVSSDVVLQQVDTGYDEDGNVIATTTRQRFHDDPTSGTNGLNALLGPAATTGPKARAYYQVFYYDAADRPTDAVDVGTNGGSAYTAPGSVPTSSASVHVTHTGYNSAGWADQVTDPAGHVSLTFYDLLGRTMRTVAAWDQSSDESDVTSTPINVGGTDDAHNQITDYTYDGDDHVVTQKAWNHTGAATNAASAEVTTYAYGVTQAGGSAVDSQDLLASVTYPGATNTASYTYFATGDVQTMTDRNGTTHAYGYDALGRSTSDHVTAFGSGVDTGVVELDTNYNDAGLAYLFTSKDGSGTIVNQVQQAFNGLGDLVAEYQQHAGAVNTATTPNVQYVYDLAAGHDRLIEMVYPNGRILHYDYAAGVDDAISRTTGLADDNGSGDAGQHLVDYNYLGLSTIVQEDRPEQGIMLTYVAQSGDTLAGGDGGDQYAGLDRFGQVADQNWIDTSTGASISREQYGYDADGNVLYRLNLVQPSMSELYSYDSLNRLATFARGTLNTAHTAITTPSTLAGSTQDWNLDSQGNWSSVTTDGTSQTRSANDENQYTAISGATTPAYDANGNLTTDETGHREVYDAWNRLVAYTTGSEKPIETYAYDALGRRTSESDIPGEPDVTELYYGGAGGQQVIEEWPASMTRAGEQYVWGLTYVNDLIVRDRDADFNASTGAYGKSGSGLEQRLYTIRDANHDVTGITSASGSVLQRWSFTSYGDSITLDPNWSVTTDPYGWNYLFQGGRKDSATGLYHYQARDYDATLGRWTEEDNGGGYVDGANLYQMERGDPSSSTDPSGTLRLADAIVNIETDNFRGVPTSMLSMMDIALALRARRIRINNDLSSLAVARGVRLALYWHGIKNVCPTSHDKDFAMIGAADYASISNAAGSNMKGDFSTHDGASTFIDLGDGFALKFYATSSGTYKVAVVHSTMSTAHFGDAAHFYTSSEEINGDTAEEYGGFAVVSDEYLYQLRMLSSSEYDRFLAGQTVVTQSCP